MEPPETPEVPRNPTGSIPVSKGLINVLMLRWNGTTGRHQGPETGPSGEYRRDLRKLPGPVWTGHQHYQPSTTVLLVIPMIRTDDNING